MTHRTMSERSYHGATSRSPPKDNKNYLMLLKYSIINMHLFHPLIIIPQLIIHVSPVTSLKHSGQNPLQSKPLSVKTPYLENKTKFLVTYFIRNNKKIFI